MNYLRPTDQRKKDDLETVFKVLRVTNGFEYQDYFNPFEAGTLRHSRFERYYRREQKKWIEMEARMEGLAEIYGEFRPDKLGLIPPRPSFAAMTEKQKRRAVKNAK